MDFKVFSKLVHDQYADMAKGELFVVGEDNRVLETVYLASFPEGTNPIYLTRTEHDCSCCKNFIRNFGHVVSIKNGKIRTVWDITGAGETYDLVASKMAEYVRAQPITNLFRTKEPAYGAENTKQLVDGKVINWNHFHGVVQQQHRQVNPEEVTGEFRTKRQLFRRGLTEQTAEGLKQVRELIRENAIYRGKEFSGIVDSFISYHEKYHAASAAEKELIVWGADAAPAVLAFNNSAIGNLCGKLSAGDDLESSVKMYEASVAPSNYKRSTALITQGMITQAVKTLQDLGLDNAVNRRLANISDVSVNNVLWVDGAVKSKMKNPITDLLMETVAPAKVDIKKYTDIGIHEFMDMLPKVKGLSLLVKNLHVNNLVTLTAPVIEGSGDLFKWDNNFAWSYNGNITDSFMRREVQARGGSVTGVFRFTHSWNHDVSTRNTSLMDLHVFMPGSGIGKESGINDDYGNIQRVGWNHRADPASGGKQDVDYTDAAPVGKIPVENITFPSLDRMPDGAYICKVHNWALRNGTVGGFEAEIEFGGQIFAYAHPKPLAHKQWVTVAVVTKKKGEFTIEHCLPTASSSKTTWGIKTEDFTKVETLMYSPNYWDGQAIGNKHWLFMLEGCKTDEPARGIYNEFLRADLNKHRKVFEVLGNKTLCPVVDNQLSGVGFSSTKNDSILAKVTTTAGTRVYNINFKE